MAHRIGQEALHLCCHLFWYEVRRAHLVKVSLAFAVPLALAALLNSPSFMSQLSACVSFESFSHRL
jgi:hypothetical protein